MKNVAATSGQSVSLATLFFTLGITREGSGWELILNSIFTLVLLRETRSRRCVDRSPVALENNTSSHSQDTRVAPACKEKMHLSKIFSCLANRSSAPHDLKGESVWTTMKPIRGQRRPTGSECPFRELQDKQGKVKTIGGGQ